MRAVVVVLAALSLFTYGCEALLNSDDANTVHAERVLRKDLPTSHAEPLGERENLRIMSAHGAAPPSLEDTNKDDNDNYNTAFVVEAAAKGGNR